MTDDSDIILRWVVNNATARLASGTIESEVFEERGFKWRVIARRGDDGLATFDLQCGVDHNGSWLCDAGLFMVLLRDGTINHLLNLRVHRFAFDEKNSVMQQQNILAWAVLSDEEHYNLNDKLTMEFHLRIISSDRGTFTVPNNRSNVILVIGEKKVHVNKEFLSIFSPVFETIFFGEFAEKGKDEVEIKDVIYKEFVDLLELMYQETPELTNLTVPHILKLADRFQMKVVINRVESYLIRAAGFHEKLQVADQYRLVKLRDHCLKSFTSHAELIHNCQSLDWADFSAETKCAIHDRLMKIK